PIRTAVAADMPNRSAAARTVMPSFNAVAMRLSKSRERGRTIFAGLHTSNDLESQNQRQGNLSTRFRLALTDSRAIPAKVRSGSALP
ncbi:hypothetical protein, partial [Rhizobium esperanzae]|uniref:hypothetical protein n=1 Tax=Rhizobium esperanzae TaxID=1967781 RepID=UPI001AEE85C1